MVLVCQVVEDDSCSSIRVKSDGEEIGQGPVSTGGGTAKSCCTQLAIIRGMLASLDLKDGRGAGCRVLDLGEIGEPFERGCCLSIVKPAWEIVGVAPSDSSVEDNVYSAWVARYCTRHHVRISRVSVHL